MKKFIITETKPAVYTWTYELEAENEEKAIEMVRYGEVEPIEFGNDCELSEDSDFEIEEIEN
jgi:hypothetical protein